MWLGKRCDLGRVLERLDFSRPWDILLGDAEAIEHGWK